MQTSTAGLAAIKELTRRGALVEARDLLASHLDRHSDDVEAHKICAEVHFKLGRREEGFRFAIRTYELDPSAIGYGLDCAFNLVRAGWRNDALRIALAISERAPKDPYHCDTLGTVFTHCEVPEKAIPHYERACALVEDSPQFFFNLASAQRMIGAARDAEASLDRSLRLDPFNGAAYLARAALRRQTPDRNHVDELKTALSRAEDVNAQVSIGYALAKELEDLAQHRQSFAYLAAASRLHRSGMRYAVDDEIELIGTVRDLDYGTLSHGGAEPNQGAAEPIFVMGLPRSGTTLVERIIASVPGVSSAGESRVLSSEVWRIVSRKGRLANPHAALVETIRQSAAEIGANYVSSFARRFNGAFIDKTPDNYIFAGLIKASVPRARMICLRRNAMDSCYAMYKMLFGAAYPFSYDLNELADYYVAWDRLIRRWESDLGDAWLTVNYEDIVREPESTMRRIVAHCGLPWDQACLRFHELNAPVTSASAGQVTRPLHGESIGLWRNYSAELRELADRLRDAGIAID